jgi:ribonuclease HII
MEQILELLQEHPEYIALGIDEAARGPLAGPMVVAGVIFKPDFSNEIKAQIKDSKKLSEKKRNELFDYILKNTHHKICIIQNTEIDNKGLGTCLNESVNIIFETLKDLADVVIYDGDHDPIHNKKFYTLIKGDSYIKEISAASILAKVIHDKYMYQFDKLYPQYCFPINKGYGTKEHIELIKKFGRSPVHRTSFKIKGYDKEITPYERRLEEEKRIHDKLKKLHSL